MASEKPIEKSYHTIIYFREQWHQLYRYTLYRIETTPFLEYANTLDWSSYENSDPAAFWGIIENHILDID